MTPAQATIISTGECTLRETKRRPLCRTKKCARMASLSVQISAAQRRSNLILVYMLLAVEKKNSSSTSEAWLRNSVARGRRPNPTAAAAAAEIQRENNIQAARAQCDTIHVCITNKIVSQSTHRLTLLILHCYKRNHNISQYPTKTGKIYGRSQQGFCTVVQITEATCYNIN